MLTLPDHEGQILRAGMARKQAIGVVSVIGGGMGRRDQSELGSAPSAAPRAAETLDH